MEVGGVFLTRNQEQKGFCAQELHRILINFMQKKKMLITVHSYGQIRIHTLKKKMLNKAGTNSIAPDLFSLKPTADFLKIGRGTKLSNQ